VRIGIIAPPWLAVPPNGYGGTEAVLDVLARGLVQAGHDVLLYATGDSTCPVPMKWTLPEAAGTVAASSATEFHHVINAYDAMVKWGPDIVHDHTLVGPVYAQTLDLAVVTTNHGPFDSELADYYRAIAPSVPIIAISNHQASTAVDTRIATVIYHGVDVESFPMGDGSGGYACFLGRMNTDKGVHTAIGLARAAGMPLKIAAKLQEPAEIEYFDAEVAPLLGRDVEYVGEVGGREKLDLLGGAVCLLNPLSWPEPFGMVMIESLACGTPVVATACGSVPELIDDGVTGFICESEEDLADCLGRIGSLDRGRCRETAANRFGTERMAADHVRFYTSVVGGRRPQMVA
jgi:glycosyltransferase involved in cell wall biosynthesis